MSAWGSQAGGIFAILLFTFAFCNICTLAQIKLTLHHGFMGFTTEVVHRCHGWRQSGCLLPGLGRCWAESVDIATTTVRRKPFINSKEVSSNRQSSSSDLALQRLSASLIGIYINWNNSTGATWTERNSPRPAAQEDEGIYLDTSYSASKFQVDVFVSSPRYLRAL